MNDKPSSDEGLGQCDVRGCREPACCEWPLLNRRLCSKHNVPKYAPEGAFDPPDDFDYPDPWGDDEW
jgi:hypothetical protein